MGQQLPTLAAKLNFARRQILSIWQMLLLTIAYYMPVTKMRKGISNEEEENDSLFTAPNPFH